MDQAFPLRFCILQAIKNWTVGRPGNGAIHKQLCLCSYRPKPQGNIYILPYPQVACTVLFVVLIRLHNGLQVLHQCSQKQYYMHAKRRLGLVCLNCAQAFVIWWRYIFVPSVVRNLQPSVQMLDFTNLTRAINPKLHCKPWYYIIIWILSQCTMFSFSSICCIRILQKAKSII